MPVSLGTAFLATLVVLLLLRHAAPKLGLVDHPNGHRQHKTPAALVGGLAIFVGCAFTILLLELPLGQFRALLLGSGVLVMIGVLDDVHDLPSSSRFVAQIVAAALMIYVGKVAIRDFGDLFGTGPVGLGALVAPLTIFATVGLVNAFNMVDGVDGLAGSLILTPIVALYLMSGGSVFEGSHQILLMVSGGLLAFLVLNFPVTARRQATVFLGDAGSMFLGFLLCWFLVDLSQGAARVIDPVTALWVTAVPLMDTTSVMTRRMVLGRSPFQADRMHIHHLLLHSGMSRIAIVLTITAMAVAAAAFGVVGDYLDWSEPMRFGLFLLLFAVYYLLTFRYAQRHGLCPSGATPVSEE